MKGLYFSSGIDKGFETDLRRMNSQLNDFTAGVGTQADKINSDFKGIGNAIKNIAALGGISLVGAQLVELGKDTAKYRDEISKLTKLQGAELDTFTADVIATANTFGKSVEEVALASSNFAKGMNIGFAEALSEVQRGFIEGADGSGEFLDQLREYSPLLKEAGLSAKEARALMTAQVDAGIFSDKGIDTIKEGNIRLREMTESTAKAIDGIGLSSKEIEAGLRAGTTTTFEVIQQVADKLAELPATSAQVGTAIADIFGGAGEDAGIEFLKMLGSLEEGFAETNKELTKTQEQEQRLLDINKEIQQSISSLLGEGNPFKEIEIGAKEALKFLLDNKEVILSVAAALGVYKAQLAIVNKLKLSRGNDASQAEAQQLAKLIPEQERQAMGITNINRLTTEQIGLIKQKTVENATALNVEIARLKAVQTAAILEAQTSKGNIATINAKIAASKRELSQAIANRDLTKARAVQQRVLNLEDKLSVEISKKKAAQTIISTTKTKLNTAEQKLNTIQTNISAAADKSAAIAKNGLAAASYKLSNGLKSLRAAAVANPLGLVVTALSVAVPLIMKFVDKQKELNRETVKLNAEIKKEQFEINGIFDALKKTNPETDERNRLIKQLNDKYPDLIGNYDLEKASLKEIEIAQNAVNQKIIENIALRSKQEKIDEIGESLYKAQGKAINKLLNIDRIDKGTLTAYFQKINEDIEKGGSNILDLAKKYAKEMGIAISYGSYATQPGSKHALTDFDYLLQSIQASDEAWKEFKASKQEIEDFTNAFLKQSTGQDKFKIEKSPFYFEFREGVEGELSEEEKKELADKYKEQLKAYEQYLSDQKSLYEKYNSDVSSVTEERKTKVDELYKFLTEQGNTYIEFLNKELNKENDLGKKEIIKQEIKTVTLDTAVEAEKQKEEEEQINKEKLDELLNQYGDYLTKRKALIDKANTKLKVAEKNNVGDKVKGNIIEELNKQLDELNSAYATSTQGINKLFTDTKNKSLEELQELKNGAVDILDYIDGKTKFRDNNMFGLSQDKVDSFSPETVDMIRKSVEGLTTSIQDTDTGFSSLISSFQQMASSDTVAGVEEGAGGVTAALQTIVTIAEEVAETLIALSEATGSEVLEVIATYVTDILDTFNKLFAGITEGFKIAKQIGGKLGLIVGALVGVLLPLIQIVSSFVKKTKEANEEIERNFNEAYVSIIEKTEAFYRDLSRIQKKYDTSFGKFEFGEGFEGSAESIKAATAQLNKYMTALNGVEVKTKDRRWRKDEYKDLLELFPQLINEQGKLNTVVAESVLDSGILGGNEENILKGALEASYAIEEAYEAMGEYMASVFGDVASEASKAFRDIYENGSDAFAGLEQSMTDMIESFSQQAIDFAFIKPLTDELQSAAQNIGKDYTAGNISLDTLQESIVLELGDFYKDLNTIQPAVLEAYSKADEIAAKAGFNNAFDGSESAAERSNAGKVSESITEATGTEIVGGINATRLSNERIASYSADALELATNSLIVLGQIKRNTDYLPEIAENTKKTYQKLGGI